jgi:hypothetical protein
MVDLNILKLVCCISIKFLVEDMSVESPIISIGHHAEEFIRFDPVRNQNEKKEPKDDGYDSLPISDWGRSLYIDAHFSNNLIASSYELRYLDDWLSNK